MRTRSVENANNVGLGEIRFAACRPCIERASHRTVAEWPYAVIGLLWVLGACGLLIVPSLSQGGMNWPVAATLLLAFVAAPTFFLLRHVRRAKSRLSARSDAELFQAVRANDFWQSLLISEYVKRDQVFLRELRRIGDLSASTTAGKCTRADVAILYQMPSGKMRVVPSGTASAVKATHWFDCLK